MDVDTCSCDCNILPCQRQDGTMRSGVLPSPCEPGGTCGAASGRSLDLRPVPASSAATCARVAAVQACARPHSARGTVPPHSAQATIWRSMHKLMRRVACCRHRQSAQADDTVQTAEHDKVA